MSYVYYILIVVMLVLVSYVVIPDLFLHRFGIGSWKRQYTPGVVITFDDGPNPEVTPRILEVLDKYGATATFFVTGEKADRYPDLIRKIINCGHQIGAHSQSHSNDWFMSPWQTWREWEMCVRIIENLTGEAVEWIRPPWGNFNLFTWLWIIVHGKRAVLWNAEGHDWDPRRTPEQIADRILRKVSEGTIIVLHDAGEKDASRDATVQALDLVCQQIIKTQKLPLVGLQFPEWSWRRRVFFKIWEKWERLYARIYNVERISSTNIFRLNRSKYPGPDLFDDNSNLLIKKGDTVGEIHLENSRLQGKDNDIYKVAFKIIRLAQKSLPEMALYVAENPKYKEIEIFMGLTMIHGVEKFGFNVQEIPITGLNRGIFFLQKIILRVYRPTRKVRTDRPGKSMPKLVWISRQQLFDKWLHSDINLSPARDPKIHMSNQQ